MNCLNCKTKEIFKLNICSVCFEKYIKYKLKEFRNLKRSKNAFDNYKANLLIIKIQKAMI